MAEIAVPEGGLALIDPLQSLTGEDASMNQGKPCQFIRLDLPKAALGEILRNARHGGKGVNVSFGKTITLHYGKKSQHLDAIPSPSPTHVYEYSSDNVKELALAGRLSHQLAMRKAQEDVAGVDEALAKLQSQLNSHEKAKQSKQIKYVPDSSNLPSLVKHTPAALKQQSVKSNSPSFMNQHKGSAKFNSSSIIRSMPASPSLGAARDAPDPKAISTSMPPTVPNDRTQKLRAIRTPLIHFLAARPASTKLLITHLGCKEDEIIELLQKVGKKHRLIPDKWTLTDKAFKELDVWNFDYPNQDDRQLAIDCAISAFDRMRLSTQEKYWDMLLPKQERGKGKILSNLDLHKGPIQQSSTPRIQVQYPSSEPNKKESANGHESDQKDRLAPSDAEPKARSKSHNQIKKTKASEKEAQSKRLLCKGPKKPTPTPKATEVHPAVKKGGGGKKGNAPKSSEFVNESDEEDGLEDAAVSYNQPTTPKQSSVPAETSNVAAPTPSTTTTPKSVGTSAKTSKSTLSAPPVESKLLVREKGSKSSTASNSQLSSNSKPVVANRASGNGAKSEERRSENIPSTLSSSVQDKKGATSTPSSPAPRHRTSEASQGSMTMKKTHSRQRTISSPHKPSPLGSSPPTNASDLENSVRSSSSSASMLSQSQKNNATPNGLGLTVNGQGRKTSEHYLKRKADEVDSDIHAHGSPLINGNATSSKRYKTSHVSPPTSESSISPPATSHTLVRAQDFKAYYAKYEIMYREVSESDDPPQEKIENVKKMHQRLTELKDELSRRARKSGEEGRRT